MNTSLINVRRFCAAALAFIALHAQAQDVRIIYRPLTPQNITDFGLPAATQKGGGAPNSGIGQPIYMEAMVATQTVVVAGGVTSRFTTAVTSVDWSVVGAPAGSTAIMLPSPLSNSVPTYDAGDRIGYFVAGRAVFTPDLVSDFDFGTSSINDFKIRTVIGATNKTISVTNLAYGAVYLGHKHYLCILCHADKQAAYDETRHANTFTELITGVNTNHFSINCIKCHTVGYDTTPGATNDGFDDIAAQIGWTFPSTPSPTNWTGMSSNLQNKANVQCENCHGPAASHMLSLGRTNAIDISLSAGTCGQCHDSLPHHVKNYEWGQTPHAIGPDAFRTTGACRPCHSAAGFIDAFDPNYAATNKNPRATGNEGITCQACHDPHEVGMGDKQLRNIPTATLSNGVVITYAQAGEGVLCMNCHHGRQNANTFVTNASISSFNIHFSVQSDMLSGENGIEYGLNMPSSRHMLAVTNSCVGCHMQLIAQTSFSNLDTKVGGHTFMIQYEGPTNEIAVTEVCSKCHVEKGTFDIAAEDYDRNGTVQGVQTEIQGLLAQLGLLLPPIGSTQVTVSASYTLQQRKAAYNYFFVSQDSSFGIHNPKYAAALLQASIDDLRGGIDIDHDGLTDTWEMLKFGNLTSQTGAGDADNDGVSNATEEDMGTNPNSGDTDNDGISDLAELQGGSDPLNFASTLPTNTVLDMMPAVELSYLPGQAGVTQVFQTADAMGNGNGWTNAGPNFISSNSPAYQLISLRDTTNKFYRVVKP